MKNQLCTRMLFLLLLFNLHGVRATIQVYEGFYIWTGAFSTNANTGATTEIPFPDNGMQGDSTIRIFSKDVVAAPQSLSLQGDIQNGNEFIMPMQFQNDNEFVVPFNVFETAFLPGDLCPECVVTEESKVFQAEVVKILPSMNNIQLEGDSLVISGSMGRLEAVRGVDPLASGKAKGRFGFFFSLFWQSVLCIAATFIVS